MKCSEMELEQIILEWSKKLIIDGIDMAEKRKWKAFSYSQKMFTHLPFNNVIIVHKDF